MQEKNVFISAEIGREKCKLECGKAKPHSTPCNLFSQLRRYIGETIKHSEIIYRFS
jgi:hypothetical protein